MRVVTERAGLLKQAIEHRIPDHGLHLVVEAPQQAMDGHQFVGRVGRIGLRPAFGDILLDLTDQAIGPLENLAQVRELGPGPLHHPLVHQLAQRFAHRGRADAETGGEITLGDLLARPQRALPHRNTKPPISLVGRRRRPSSCGPAGPAPPALARCGWTDRLSDGQRLLSGPGAYAPWPDATEPKPQVELYDAPPSLSPRRSQAWAEEQATARVDDMTGDPAGVVGSEEGDHAGLRRRARPAG